MKKITKSDLERLEKRGATIKRKMGTGNKPEKTKTSSKQTAKTTATETPHAAMAASMAASMSQIEATQKIVAQNGVMIEKFIDSLKSVVTPREPASYTFDIRRDTDGLLERVYARPGILEG